MKYIIKENSSVPFYKNGKSTMSIMSSGKYENDIEEVSKDGFDYYKINIDEDRYFIISKSKITLL